jgi:hypothetical protein
MKYKVIYQEDNSGGGAPDIAVSCSFYTFNQAHLSAQGWAGISPSRSALLWDGALWRFY